MRRSSFRNVFIACGVNKVMFQLHCRNQKKHMDDVKVVQIAINFSFVDHRHKHFICYIMYESKKNTPYFFVLKA